jgi:hypothetical protein
VLRGAIDLATSAPDPVQRTQVWRLLREADAPALRQALITTAHEERDSNVRVEITAMLAGDASDPAVRAVLEQIAREDTRPLVRAIAQRGISGEPGWRQYMLSSLQDTSLPATQRIEAVFHALEVPMVPMPAGYGRARGPNSLASFDDAVLVALAKVLPEAARESEVIRNGSLLLVQEMGSIDHPAITKMLLDVVQGDDKGIDRSFAAIQLARRVDDPAVRAVLEKLADADTDPDAQLREAAAWVLQSSSAR